LKASFTASRLREEAISVRSNDDRDSAYGKRWEGPTNSHVNGQPNRSALNQGRKGFAAAPLTLNENFSRMSRVVADSALERYLVALSQRDFDRLQALFHPAMRFRALIPPGFREGSDAEESVAHFRRWFGPAEIIEVLASDVEELGERSRFTYKLHVREEGKWYVVAQQAFCTFEGDTIVAMDLVCSGFMPEPA
jgi:hypothetical protein